MKKILWSLIAATALLALYTMAFHSDWVVIPPKSKIVNLSLSNDKPIPVADLPTPEPALALAPVPTPVATAPAAVAQPAKPVGVHGHDSYGTPIPNVAVTQPVQPWVRSDGYFNYCYKMTDGTWTTVIGQITLGPDVYYYAGPIDAATQAPAYADQSQTWCAENIPS